MVGGSVERSHGTLPGKLHAACVIGDGVYCFSISWVFVGEVNGVAGNWNGRGIDLLEISQTFQTMSTRVNPHPFSFLFQLAKSDV